MMLFYIMKHLDRLMSRREWLSKMERFVGEKVVRLF
jgi:hypothetical protein